MEGGVVRIVNNDTRVAQARQILQQILQLLLTHGESAWSGKIARADELMESDSDAAVAMIRSFFGGMGSLSDLTLLALNGHDIRAEDELRVNSELRLYVSNLWNTVRSWKEASEADG